jgi:hypothetical protein
MHRLQHMQSSNVLVAVRMSCESMKAMHAAKGVDAHVYHTAGEYVRPRMKVSL